MTYSSLDNKVIKQIKKLRQKKYRDEQGRFLVEGEHLVMEASKSGFLEYVICEEHYVPSINKNNIFVTSKVMRYLSALDHPNTIMGVCRKLDERQCKNRVLLLDGIQDPGNLGTIIRSAVAFNFDTIVLSDNTVDLYNEKVLRATQGLIFHINIIVKPLKDIIYSLKEKKYTIVGTRVSGGMDIRKFHDIDKLVLIVGNEGQGVSEDILNLCDRYAYISMNENCESLNVGVATGIMLYELAKN